MTTTLGSTPASGNRTGFKSALQRMQGLAGLPGLPSRPMDNLAFDDLKLFEELAALGTLSAVSRERDLRLCQISRHLTRIESARSARQAHRSTHWQTWIP